MASAQVLKVTATDPASEKDFKLFATQSDNEILDFKKDAAAYFYWIRKA
jgi:tRNA 2-thiouridine synthesizing protein A